MSKIHFTDLALRALSPGVYFDRSIPAFGLRVGKSRRTWFIIHGTDRLRTTIGPYPSISLADARKRALAIKVNGTTEPRSLPFPEARRLFLEARASDLKPRSHAEISRTLVKHFTWTKTLDKITHSDIATAIDAIEKRSEANHAFKDIRTFFNWCVPRYLKHSPCAGLKMPHKAPSRARVLTDAELKRIWNACDTLGASPRHGTDVGAANCAPIPSVPAAFPKIVQLLILTGQRRGEIAALQSNFVDLDTKVVTFPSALMKNGREHAFPIASLASAILSPLIERVAPADLRVASKPMLFPARGKDKSPFNGWSKSKIALDMVCGVKGWTLHDLRRTYATMHASIGTPPHIVERLLNHASGTISGVAAIYNRSNAWTRCACSHCIRCAYRAIARKLISTFGKNRNREN